MADKLRAETHFQYILGEWHS